MCPVPPPSSLLICHDAETPPPLETLCHALQLLGRHNCWTPTTLNRVNLIVEEILQNVFDHGAASGTVRVRVQTLDDRLDVVIHAPGRGVDPREGPRLNRDEALESREPGGLGLHLVREFCSHIELVRRPDSYQLHLQLARD